MSDLRTVLRDVGGVFVAIGFITLIALAVPLFFQEYYGILPILLTSGIFFLIGTPFYLLFKKSEQSDFKSAMITAALGWLLISIISSLPFFLIPFNLNTGQHMDFLSAFFESMSGWTGTGLTMVDKENLLPYTLQFWRTWIQWVGGVGVIVLTLSILARPGTGSYVLYKGEARDQKTHPSIVSTVRTIWWIFLLYTIIGIAVVTILGFIPGIGPGMDPWQALNHGMTGLATGGFSVTDDSITSFGAVSQIAIVVLMVFGAIAFAAHYNLLKGRLKDFFSDAQFRAMLILFALGIIVLTAINFYDHNLAYDGNVFLAIKESGFQFVSALTCTGFASADIPIWSESAKLLLSFAMVIGGAAGSTAGGIKLFRAILLSKGVSWRIKRAISTPRRVFVHKLGEKPLSKDDAMDLINEAAIISFIWIIILSVGILFIGALRPDQTLGNIIFEVCSAQGNVGLSTGITSYSLQPAGKFMLIINMWIGRLEIIPVIVLIKSLFGIRRNLL